MVASWGLVGSGLHVSGRESILQEWRSLVHGSGLVHGEDWFTWVRFGVDCMFQIEVVYIVKSGVGKKFVG